MDRDEARRLARARLRLGDRLEAVLKATGVQAAVQAVERRTGWRCGCAKRKAWLNRW